FTHCSPGSLDYDTSQQTLTPPSTQLISPKVSISDLSFPCIADPESEAAEALSQHHLQRYLHYKALSAKAEAEALVSSQTVDALLAACDTSAFPVPPMSHDDSSSAYINTPAIKEAAQAMLSYPQHPSQQSYFGVAHPQQHPMGWNQPFAYAAHPQWRSHQENMFHPQQQPRQMYYLPPSSSSRFEQTPSQSQSQIWSRHSGSTTVSGASPPFPSTPNYPMVPPGSSFATIQPPSLPPTEGEEDLEEDEDELNEYDGESRNGEASMEDIKPIISGMPIPNLHGGGRGYVPGKTPDDPKKRHKCNVCGRGFARAFNLKSHAQTHNPLRPKPYQCPHSTCKRGFSRLHDLERHRQGIHSDGPLVDAKRHGIAPAAARAQDRIQTRAERGTLI
ncbi:hypothetical protein P7C73_g4777, partial [Tremellales sp. Uapishka_1]